MPDDKAIAEEAGALCKVLLEPIDLLFPPKKAASQLRMVPGARRHRHVQAASLFCERAPETVQKHAVRKLPSGNDLTDSRYRNWSNQAVLVERQYFFRLGLPPPLMNTQIPGL